MNWKLKIFSSLIVITFSFVCIASLNSMDAYAGYGTGGAPGYTDPTPSDCGSGWQNFCCYEAEHCPQWLLVTKETYNNILDSGRVYGSYSGLDTCRNDEYVVITGNYKLDGNLWINNITGDRPNPVKETYSFLNFDTNWGANGTKWGFMNSIAGAYNGQSITYGQLMEKVIKESGVSEQNLAAYCMAAINQPEYVRRLTLLGSSNPEADFPSGETWTKDSPVIKNSIIDYNKGGFSSGVDKQTVSGGSIYNSAIAPKTLSVNGVTYTINRVIATEYVDNRTDCNNDNISFKHLQSEAYKSSGTINGCQDIYIVYEKPNVTLNAYAVVAGGQAFLNNGNKLTTNPPTMPVVNGTNVSVTEPGFTGYNFKGWYAASSNNKEGCKTYSDNITSNKTYSTKLTTSGTVCAVYETRKSFQARARAVKGNAWSNSNSVSTGFVESGSKTYSMPCDDNSGCTATFFLDLKTILGSGSTTYTIQKSTNGGSSWSNVTNYINKTATPANSSDGTEVYNHSEKIPINSTVCYRIEYKPYGNYSNDTTKIVSTCVKTDPSIFTGKTEVNGAATATAGWTDRSNPKSIDEAAKIENCSPTNGCVVNFKHYLKRISGAASTTYNVSRTSNLITSTKGISPGTIKSDTSFSSDNETVVSESKGLTLYPGMVVCEKLTFKPNNLSGTTGNIYTQVCAHAHGNAQPPDDPEPDKPEDPNKDSGDTSFLNIKVRNSSVSKYNNYQREVYAKPGDKVVYRATYNPVLQYTFFLVPQKFQIKEDGVIYPKTDAINTELSIGTLFNTYKGKNLRNWNNAFSVQKGANKIFNSDPIANYTKVGDKYGNGDWTKRQETNEHTVAASDVGNSVDEKAVTNLNSNTQTTPSQVTFKDDVKGNNLATVFPTDISSKIASVKVPYNFVNTTELASGNMQLYAGETASVRLKYIIGTKTNSETSPERAYATRVDSAKWRLKVRIVGGETLYTETKTAKDEKMENEFVVSSIYNGKTVTPSAINFNVPDVPAGTEICLSPDIYPSHSGADTNYNNPEGSGKWLSEDTTAQPIKEQCFKVAKKPSIEIWGGNIYSRGAIETSVAVKNNVAGYPGYNITNNPNDKTRWIFGSWTESGLISNGSVKGLASGAGTGFATNNNGTLWPAYHPEDGVGNNAFVSGGNPAPGGSEEKNPSFCIRSTLTFANDECGNGVAGGLNSTTVTNNIEKDKSSILNKFITGNYNENTTGNVSINDESKKITEDGRYYYYGKNALNIPGASIAKNTIQVVHSDSNITISGNLIYNSDGGYKTLEEIPKLVIYAKNVTIVCEVSRIDALIVAENQVKTCDSDDIKSQRNSNQLKINGAIIANSLVANRTYGAATGANSIIPAEIINYDPSLYLWGGNDAKNSTSANNMDTTYIHEVAPRY